MSPRGGAILPRGSIRTRKSPDDFLLPSLTPGKAGGESGNAGSHMVPAIDPDAAQYPQQIHSPPTGPILGTRERPHWLAAHLFRPTATALARKVNPTRVQHGSLQSGDFGKRG
jgi:hypothetical protein